ncbi:nucleoside 2-deoxyribosyltransferase [Apilactobacillus ozensis]|uniref:Nucleoside 2-deoxyribosyltransferase n=1 Tax=Apilactobacillus ozensis DSM 23829 = JCM 17196 TaxID=1423781 RepID=A0A0R2AX34_9LACO|nr:nucleoside 2-deoxyribosyltransferase [Apilactobacillus ozensis]KRM67795.1 hypothetical protein FD06_GL000515 [Apilactobacillus ozensis DSM 23829 = JCM 17196]MCK8606930.1 nucleoside 2-deoxyribosyltransferase [Apilactobacillus ozensis]
MKKIYLAGPFFDDEQVSRIEKLENILTNNPTVESFFSPRTTNLPGEKPGTPEWANKIYHEDVNEILKADLVFAVIDFTGENVDSGTAFEIGYAVANKKPVVVFHEKTGIVNLMISESISSYLTTFEDVEKYDFDKMPVKKYNGPVI